MLGSEAKVQSDAEVLVKALEEAKRILAVYENANPRRNQDEVLRMLEFVLCDPILARAMHRLRLRAQLRLVV